MDRVVAEPTAVQASTTCLDTKAKEQTVPKRSKAEVERRHVRRLLSGHGDRH